MFYKKKNRLIELEREKIYLNNQIAKLKSENDLFKKENLFYEKTFLNESMFKSFVDQKNIEILSEIIKYLAIREEKIVPAIPGYNEDYQDERSGSCCHESVTWTVTATKWVEGTPAIKYYSMNSKIQTLINCIEKMDENDIKEISLIITPLSIQEIKMAFKKY